ncbi:MAG: hypothetical protein ACYSYV_02525 [Planctomycetota bacterium]
MKTTKRIVILLALALLTVGPAQSMDKPAEEISFTHTARTASCVIKVTSDPAVLPVDYDTIDALIYSSGVGGKAAREVLDISPDDISDSILIEMLGPVGGTARPQWPTSVGSTVKPSASPGARGRSTSRRSAGEYGESMYDEMMDDGRGKAKPSPPAKAQPGTSYSYGRTSSSSGASRYSYRSTRSPESTSRSRGSDYSAVRRTVPAASPISPIEQTVLFRLSIFQLPDEVKPEAEKFMSILIVYLRESLSDAFDAHKNRLTSQLNLAAEEAERAENELRNKQEVLREISGSRSLDRNRILADIRQMRSGIRDAEMHQASEQVTIEATTERIADIEANTNAQIANDAVTKELRDLLDLQVANLEGVESLYKTGTASAADVADARERLARAKIELAQRREQMSKSAGGNLIELLNGKLVESSIATAQDKAHLSLHQKQLAEAEVLLQKADDYELLSLKADIAKQNLQEAIVWRDRMSRQMRMLQPPMVSVIGAE